MSRFLPLAALLLAASGVRAEPDSLLLRESRAWRGVVEVRSQTETAEGVEGGETHTERVEFVLVSDPPRQIVARPRIPFRLRETSGSYETDVDITETLRTGPRRVVGEGAGDLFPRVGGHVEPDSGRYWFGIQLTPARIKLRTSTTGTSNGRITTFRNVESRTPYLQGFKTSGTLQDEGRLAQGEKRLRDARSRYPRDVRITWRIERIDPVLAGRVVGPDGQPLEGLRIHARTTNPVRIRQKLPPLLRETKTDADGRFLIHGWTGFWNVEVLGEARRGALYLGEYRPGVHIQLAEVPELNFELKAYRHRELPQPHLLEREFQGDVRRYFEYLNGRFDERRIAAASILPPAER